jgi:cellulose synthase/poly-beta-1,6-N-acetylglucosamine synthase-like glycosyltransferase
MASPPDTQSFPPQPGNGAGKRAALAGLVFGVGGGTLLAPETTLAVLFAVMAFPFLFVVVLRSAALWNLVAPPAPAAEPPPVRIDAELLPLYREASVVQHLVAALTAIDYPAARLEILLVVESIDADTQTALRAAALPPHMRILVVPDGDPRTKPRAIKYALRFAHGDYVVVYGAEDVPEPDQLRRALAALMAEPGRLGCLQARLNIYNSRASWLTRGSSPSNIPRCSIASCRRSSASNISSSALGRARLAFAMYSRAARRKRGNCSSRCAGRRLTGGPFVPSAARSTLTTSRAAANTSAELAVISSRLRQARSWPHARWHT